MNSLCYNKEKKCLYKGVSDSDDILFSEHAKKGYKLYKIQIPNEPVEIIISSNLYFQGASYLFAKIIVNGKTLLNFQDRQALYLVNHCSLDTFQVSAGEWNELFDIIIRSYNNMYFTSEEDIDKYFKELDDIISSENIVVFRNKTDKKPCNWDGSFLVLLHSADIISNIIKCKDVSMMKCNTFFEKKLLKICMNYLQRFSICYPKWALKDGDTRLTRLSDELFAICEYVKQKGNPFDFVSSMLNNKCN